MYLCTLLLLDHLTEGIGVVAVHLGVKMADTLSFTAKVDSKMWSGIVHHKSDRKSCVLPTADRNRGWPRLLFCFKVKVKVRAQCQMPGLRLQLKRAKESHYHSNVLYVCLWSVQRACADNRADNKSLSSFSKSPRFMDTSMNDDKQHVSCDLLQLILAFVLGSRWDAQVLL